MTQFVKSPHLCDHETAQSAVGKERAPFLSDNRDRVEVPGLGVSSLSEVFVRQFGNLSKEFKSAICQVQLHAAKTPCRQLVHNRSLGRALPGKL
jgi:hypothetical protein